MLGSSNSSGAPVQMASKEKYRSQFNLALRVLVRDRLALAGAVIILAACLIAALAPLISPYNPTVADSSVLRLAPIGSPGHILGTDTQGRDILSRLIWGGRVSIPIAILPSFISAFIALFLGIAAGYRRGIFGEIIMRVCDIFFAFPMVLLAVAMSTILGPGMMNLMLSVSIVLVPYITRVVYIETVTFRDLAFIEAAKVSGSSTGRIIFGELLPNVLPPVMVYTTTIVGGLIVFAAGLSFLGLGVQPPTADWGIMCSDGRVVLAESPHITAIPGIVIVIVAVAFNLLGDGLRDALDPRRRTGR